MLGLTSRNVVRFLAQIDFYPDQDCPRKPVPTVPGNCTRSTRPPAGGSEHHVSTKSPPDEFEFATGDLPPFVQAELNEPPPLRGSWVWTIGPAYAGGFIWIPLIDRLGCWLAGQASLGWLIATAVLAVLACHFLLYHIPAMWGWTSGRRLGVVAASTFGTTGSEWVAGVGVGLGGLAFYAISIDLAIKLIMLGLLSAGLIDQDVFETMEFRAP